LPEPLSLDDVKEALRLDLSDTSEDGYLDALCSAARAAVEGMTGLLLVPIAGMELIFDDFGNADSGLRLPAWPVRLVSDVTYLDTNGEGQVLTAGDDWRLVAKKPARLLPAAGTCWPQVLGGPGSVIVTLNAGYATATEVSPALKQAMHLLIGNWYRNREADVIGATALELPNGVERLVAPHRMWWV